MTVADLYEREIKRLTTSERLALANMIFDRIPPASIVDYREEWCDEDRRDFTSHSMRQLAARWVAAEADDA